MNRKIIAVVGPTTAPGRGLVRAILNDKQSEFVARALTRDLASEEAQLLGMAGIEVAVGDLNDEASLRRGFSEAYGAFCLVSTNDAGTAPEKLARAVIMARAARGAALKHVVWATLEDARGPTSGGDLDATPTYLDNRRSTGNDSNRMTSDKAFVDFGVPVTFLRTSWGTATATGSVAEEIGKCAYRIFRSPDLIGKTLSISEELMALEAVRPAPGSTAPPVRNSKSLSPWLWLAIVAGVLAGVGLVKRFYRTEPSLAEHAMPAKVPARKEQPVIPIVPLDAHPTGGDHVFTGDIAPDEASASHPSATTSTAGAAARARQKRRRHGEAMDRATSGRSRPPYTQEGSLPRLSAGPIRAGGNLPPSADGPSGAVAQPAASSAASSSPTTTSLRGEPPNLQTPGFVDPRAVTATVRAHAAEVRSCFDRALMERPELHGRLTVKAVLDGAGNVLTASSTRSMDGGGRLEACVVSAFQSWTFPAPAGRAKGPITYSFSFE